MLPVLETKKPSKTLRIIENSEMIYIKTDTKLTRMLILQSRKEVSKL